MKILSQRDPQWADVKIGQTPMPLKLLGCTVTCISMVSDLFVCYIDPGKLAQMLRFTPGARVYWESIGEIFPSIKFFWRFYTPDLRIIDEALKNPDKRLLLNIQKGKHWVLAIRRIPLTSTYQVADPWTGTRRLISDAVGGAVLARVDVAPSIPVSVPVIGVSDEKTYTVKLGDSLYSIAQKFYNDGSKWQTISVKNNISNPKRLLVGKVLIIP